MYVANILSMQCTIENRVEEKMTRITVMRDHFLRKDFLAAFVVVVNSFSWYFPLYFFFVDMLGKSQSVASILLVAISIHYVGAIGSAIVGTVLVKKPSSRSAFLGLWMLIGVLASAMLIVLDVNNVVYLLSVFFLLGISLGLGFPSALAYFGDHTYEENRGRLGGITFFFSGISMLIIGLLASIATFPTVALAFTLWRGVGLILFLLIKPKQERKQSTAEVSYKLAITDKPFVLYLVPWIMFCLVNFLEYPIVTNFFGTDLALLMPIAEFGIGGFSALIGGWFADSVGRKRIVIFGFITLGIGYAILGLFSSIPLSWYLYMILDGIAWGIFILMFYLVVWADLAGNRTKEKYYLIGVLPFIVSGFIQILFTPYAQSIPISVAFSLASFFLFLAVLPLLYAPETLSEKEIEKKRLQKYLEDVEKVKKKYEKR
jgi:MFS family permease